MSSTTDRQPSRGQALVLFAIGITAILAVGALAFDAGMMFVERREQQNAADAAALAGARYVLSSGNYSGTCSAGGGNAAVAAACAIALENRFDDSQPDQDVRVYIPPQHGRFVGLPGFIEVEIDTTRPSIFGGIIGQTLWPVGSFAVAADAENLVFPFSMLALNNTACKAIHVAGNGSVYSAGSIQSNSDGSGPAEGGGACGGVGMSRSGNGTITVDAADAFCRSVGGIQDPGNRMNCDKDPNSFMLPDPLQYLAPPPKPALAAPLVPIGHSLPPPVGCPGSTSPATEAAPGGGCVLGQGNTAPPSPQSYKDREWVLRPGLYPGGIQVRTGTVYLLPGLYWIGGGGLVVRGNAGENPGIVTIAGPDSEPYDLSWGGGILIYNTSGPNIPAGDIDMNGGSALLLLKDLDVPSGHPLADYNNMVIFQDRTVTAKITLNGSDSTSQVEGLIYAPAGEVILNGSGGNLEVDQIIADTFKINGAAGSEIRVLHRTDFDAVISGAGLVD